MKAHILPVVLLVGLLAGCATKTETQKAEDKTPYHRPLTSLGAKFGALPPAVQSTVLAEAGGAEITDALRDTSSGRVVYKIYFRDPDVFPPLFVAPDGSVLNYDLTVAVSAVRGCSGNRVSWRNLKAFSGQVSSEGMNKLTYTPSSSCQ